MKCKRCKESIDGSKEKYAKWDGRYFHIECLREDLGRRRAKYSPDEIEDIIEQAINIVRIQERNNMFKEKLNRHILARYRENLPKYVFIRISSVVNGSMEGIYKPIPYEDLYYMYKKMDAYLDKIASKKTYDNKMSQALYELSVVASNHKKYLEWKREHNINKDTTEVEIMKIKKVKTLNKIKRRDDII